MRDEIVNKIDDRGEGAKEVMKDGGMTKSRRVDGRVTWMQMGDGAWLSRGVSKWREDGLQSPHRKSDGAWRTDELRFAVTAAANKGKEETSAKLDSTQRQTQGNTNRYNT